MTIPEMIAYVLAVTQFLKEFLAKLKITIGGTSAIVLSILVSAAVTFYAKAGNPFTTSWIVDFIQVVIGANMGYKVMNSKGSVTP